MPFCCLYAQPKSIGLKRTRADVPELFHILGRDTEVERLAVQDFQGVPRLRTERVPALHPSKEDIRVHENLHYPIPLPAIGVPSLAPEGLIREQGVLGKAIK